MPYYQDNHNTIHCMDFRKNDLPDECVQMVCTSPPYWGLRKYAGEQELIWGGDENCRHEWLAGIQKWHGDRGERAKLERKEVFDDTSQVEGTPSSFCALCGAWKGAYGLEPMPEMYIEHTIEILREIRRVLRKDGVVFWNIGDSYAGSGSPGGDFRDGKGGDEYLRPYNRKGGVLKPKDLCLIPFRIAIAAQEDGWWVRSVIIWSKPNPMPESVTDRPTENHEYILMLTKAARYYWDAEAVREPYSPTERWGGDIYKGAIKRGLEGEDAGLDRERSCFPGTGRNLRTVWEFPTQPFGDWEGYNYDRADFFKDDIPYTINSKCPLHGEDEYRGKSISEFLDTSMVCICRPAEISHFAVFPEKLPELCIKAATPEVGCCSKCGSPWARALEKKPSDFNIRVRDAKAGRATPEEGYKATQEEIERYPGNHPDPGYSRTVGWRPTCKCNAPRVPSLVLDPMMGAGTTLLVAKKLNRYAVGYELSQEYCQLAVERCRQQVLL